MNERTKTGLEIIQVAVVLGVLGDILLRVMPWGLNVLLFNAAFAAGMIMLLRRRAPEYLTRQTYALFGALIFFASMFVWRDSLELRVADTIAILAVLSVLFLPKLKVSAQLAGVFHYIVGFFWSGLHAVGAPLMLVFSDIEWSSIPRSGWRKHAFAVARGMAIAAPLILIFGGLFVAADAAYQGLVERVFNIRPEIVFTHVLLFAVFSWLTAGYLSGVLIKPAGLVNIEPPTFDERSGEAGASRLADVTAESGEYPVTLPNLHSVTEHLNISDPPNAADDSTAGKPKPDKSEPWSWANFDNSSFPAVFTLGTVEVAVVLGLMNLLFLSFVIVQVPYLFGGMELVQNTPDFKLAEYARRGFGELVAVSALVLPTLLIGHWLIRKSDRFAGTIFRVLAGSQIVLLFVIMASAVQRLVLLTGSFGYGMTTIRLYPMIFMTWLAIVFIWFGATVLRGARQRFAWGALWSAFLILGAAHVLNPDAFIVKTNVALMHQGRSFDAYYNSTLSGDATLVLMDAFPDLSLDDQKSVIRHTVRKVCENSEETDFRSWNISRWQADKVIRSNERLIAAIGDCASEMYGEPEYDSLR